MTVTVTLAGQDLIVSAPFHPDFPRQARDLGGDFARPKGPWTFDARDEDRVRALLVDTYGTDGSPVGETVTVRVHASHFAHRQDAWMFGRKIAERRHRDADVYLGAGVTIVEGGFPAQGGSMSSPTLGARLGSNNGDHAVTAVLEIRDIPANHPEFASWDSILTIVGTDVDPAVLAEERARLVARIAQIDAILADRSASA